MADVILARDPALFLHILLGVALIPLSIVILLYLMKKVSWLKPLAIATAAVSWLQILPAGILYLNFYPATKTLIKAGSWVWAHDIIMETKEHWGLLLPVITTVAAALVVTNQPDKSRKWWILLIILTIAIGIMGRIVKIGAGMQA